MGEVLRDEDLSTLDDGLLMAFGEAVRCVFIKRVMHNLSPRAGVMILEAKVETVLGGDIEPASSSFSEEVFVEALRRLPKHMLARCSEQEKQSSYAAALAYLRVTAKEVIAGGPKELVRWLHILDQGEEDW